MEEKKDAKLSKSILDMKFMKRTKDRVLKEVEDAEGQAMYSKEITDEMRKSGNVIFTDGSIFHCKDLIEGRLSFGGMNPDIEKIVLNENCKKLEEVEKKKETDISDAQMAEGYSTLVSTISNKFKKKNKGPNNNHNRKFIKPANDDLY